MPAVYTTPGPVDHFVRYRTGTAYYLGTAVQSPDEEGKPAYINIFNDEGGRSVPVQKVYDGEQVYVTTTLNRFDPTIYQDLRGKGKSSAVAGFDSELDRGRLVIGINDVELILVNRYAGLANTAISNTGVASGITAQPGRRYYSALLVGWRENKIGTRVTDVSLIFECNSVQNALKQFALYTEFASTVTENLPLVN